MIRDWLVTPEFVASYEALDPGVANVVDEAITRLATNSQSAWARQGWVVGSHGAAWIVELPQVAGDIVLYWTYHGETEPRAVLLLLLLTR